jgi:hypothetical protein
LADSGRVMREVLHGKAYRIVTTPGAVTRRSTERH